MRAMVQISSFRRHFSLAFSVGAMTLLSAHSVKALDTDKDLTQCRLETWTAKDGLPSRDIESIAQTPDGYLWLATHGGLVRFDGVNFKIFSSANTPGIAHNTILSVAVDHKGTLWAGTDWDGFGTLAHGKFDRIQVDPKKKQTGWSEYRSLYVSKDGSVWAGGGGDYPVVQTLNDQPRLIPNTNAARAIMEDNEGNLWCADGQGLTQRTAKGVWKPIDKSKSNLTSLALDKEGNVWIGSDNDGLYRYRNGKFRLFTTKDGLSSNAIRALCCDRKGNLWIGTHRGINRFQSGKFTAFHRGNGLFSEDVSAILEDRESNLWVASGSGLNRFSNTPLTPLQIPDGTGFAKINHVALSKDGSVWMATGLGLMKFAHGVMKPVLTRQGKPILRMAHLFESHDGTLWMSGLEASTYTFRDGEVKCIDPTKSYNELNEDEYGILGVGADGVWRLSPTKPKTQLKGENTGYVFLSYRDRSGKMWAGTTTGFVRIRKDSAEVITKGLPKETHVLGITEDSERGMWLATDKGLIRYRDNHFTVYGKAQGLPDDNLFQIQEDKQQRLWVGGRYGIFCVKKSDLTALDGGMIPQVTVTLYSGSDGIRSFPYLNATLKLPGGELWFTGDLSTTRVTPESISINGLAPNILIEGTKGDNLPLVAGTKGLEIKAGTRDLEIAYTGLSLAAPEKMRFRYQLVGYDRNWTEAGNRRSAYYTNLPPGDYTFQVQACNNDGVWNRTGSTLALHVSPHFYQTFWFQAASTCTFFGIAGLLFHLRTRRLTRTNHLLETKVAHRTAQLLKSKHDLEDTLEELHASKEELEQANARLEALATTDGMTELANHRAFQERLQLETRPHGHTKRMALLLLDVDHFKQYNDAFGHPAGDEALRIVGKIIRESVRRGDFPARYGGEEFAALLPQSSPEGALMVAERIRAAIEEYPFPHREVTVSIGVAIWHIGETEDKPLVQRADEALYRAKRAGRNRIVTEEGFDEPQLKAA